MKITYPARFVCLGVSLWVILTWTRRGARLTFSASSLAALQETGSTSPPAGEIQAC